LSQII